MPNATEYNLASALSELDRMASTIGLFYNVREVATMIYRKGTNLTSPYHPLIRSPCRSFSEIIPHRDLSPSLRSDPITVWHILSWNCSLNLNLRVCVGYTVFTDF